MSDLWTRIRQLCTSAQGRASRKAFWLAYLIFALTCPLVAAAAIPMALLVQYLGFPDVVAVLAVAPIVIPAVALLTFGAINTMIRRFHDRGKSANWIWMLIGPGMFMQFTGIGFGDGDIDLGVFVLWGLTTLWCLVELGTLPGTPGDNMYGPSPAAVSADVTAERAAGPVAVPIAAAAPKAKRNKVSIPQPIDPVLVARAARVVSRG